MQTFYVYRHKADIIESGHTVLLQVAGHFVNALNALNSRHWAPGKKSLKNTARLLNSLLKPDKTHTPAISPGARPKRKKSINTGYG